MVQNVISVIDGAAGSCGKGKVVGEIATSKDINLGAAITNCMPNAGHTFVSNRGKKVVLRNIPVSIVNPKTELFIGPGSAIDMETFKKEYDLVEKLLGERKIFVHEMVPLVEEKHKLYEKEHVKSGSTFKGCGAVSKDKIMRDSELNYFQTYKNATCISNDEWLERLYQHLNNESEYVILEGAQGCDLDLNHSGNYPYVTSRNVGTTQLLADSGIPAERLLETILVIRPFPIRISNVTQNGDIIYSGNYGSGLPLTWSQVNIASMIGSYPFYNDVKLMSEEIDIEFINYLIKNSSDIALKQIFGDIKAVDNITLLQAIELERLFNKNDGKYKSKIITFPYCNTEVLIEDLSEQTTVTKMERRIFDLDIKKLCNNCLINNPYGLYLNFFQQLDLSFRYENKAFDYYYFNKYIREYFNWLEESTNTPILALGTGPRNNQRILKKDLIKR